MWIFERILRRVLRKRDFERRNCGKRRKRRF